MFNISLSEVFVVALVGIIFLDKKKIPECVSFIRVIYKSAIDMKFKIERFLKNTEINELYKACETEEIKYIAGKDGKFYPAYNIDNLSNKNDGKDSSS
ncbi:Sec-independent protein translocase subunit TatB [Wolbachia endosymbiont of Pentidionis agamae]|uniref:Sec-independent protein translocase subunit TatB n=1 Tax=Wolbachia endosymbiont of Pentidionis agamae TaxID=3110435 RepID=UPI002FCEF09A